MKNGRQDRIAETLTILQEKRFPKNRRKISSAETFQPLAEGFLNPILQPECPRVGRLRAG
mgnify:CR=1 FL=1